MEIVRAVVPELIWTVVLPAKSRLPSLNDHPLEFQVQLAIGLVMPKFSSEPRFEPEPLGLNPKFDSRFRAFAELDPRSSSRFSQS